MSKTIYEKFRAGAAISDSELNTCGENAIDVIRFLEKELRVVSGQYNQVVQQNKDLQKELNQCQEILVEIREDLETQVYCECSECGNDDYSECIKCMTKRYMEKINEVIPA